MIGIIIWAILIIFIVICACPGFLTALFVSSLIINRRQPSCYVDVLTVLSALLADANKDKPLKCKRYIACFQRFVLM